MSSNSPWPNPTREIIVDDTDSDIIYDYTWFQDQGGHRNWGPGYQSTSHKTSSNATFSFSFSGTQVQVLGFQQIRNDSEVIDPTVECTVDDILIDTKPANNLVVNSRLFCYKSGLQDGRHHLRVRVTVKNGQAFWFDSIRYVPSADVPLHDKTILVDSRDPGFSMSGYWQDLSGVVNQTMGELKTARFGFDGVSLSWYGLTYRRTNVARDAATGYYSVDGGARVTFSLKEIPAGNTPVTFDQKIFETPVYPPGKHELLVVWAGERGQSPLVLDYVIVKNGTIVTNTTTTTIIAPSTADPTAPALSQILVYKSSAKEPAVGTIIGVCLGVVSLVVVVALLISFARLQRRRRLQDRANLVEPWFQPGPEPLTTRTPELDQTIPQPELPPNTAKLGTSMKLRSPINSAAISKGSTRDPRGSLVDVRQSSEQIVSDHASSPMSSSRREQPLFRQSKIPLARDSPAPTDSRLFLHADSGVRTSVRPQPEEVEMPVYSPG